jgi:hypothetical protein
MAMLNNQRVNDVKCSAKSNPPLFRRAQVKILWKILRSLGEWLVRGLIQGHILIKNNNHDNIYIYIIYIYDDQYIYI